MGRKELGTKNERPLLGLNRNVFFAGLVSFFMDVSSEMIYPLVPLFLASVLGANKSLIGLIEGAAESVASLLKVFSGWSSDRLGGRKYLMVLGYSVSTLSRPIMGMAASWQHVLGARLVDRFGKGIRTAPRDAIIAESTEASQLARAFSFHRSMDTMGAVIGPLAALLLLGFLRGDFRKVFWISIVPALLAVLVIFLFIRETSRPRPATFPRPRMSLKPFNWEVKFFIGIAALFALGNSSDVFLILRAGQIGIRPAMIPAVYLLFNLVYSLSGVPFGVAADRFGRKRVILIGFVLFAFVYIGFARAQSIATIWVLFAVYGLFMGLTEGIQKAFLATIIPSDFKAFAFGVYATVVGLAMFPASLIGGWLWDRFTPATTFYFGAATAALSALLFLGLIIAARKNPEIRA